jgi:hypothetical protein
MSRNNAHKMILLNEYKQFGDTSLQYLQRKRFRHKHDDSLRIFQPGLMINHPPQSLLYYLMFFSGLLAVAAARNYKNNMLVRETRLLACPGNRDKRYSILKRV